MPPRYEIHRKVFANGREEYRIKVRRGWFWGWLYRGVGSPDVSILNGFYAHSSRYAAETEIRLHWENWLTNQPLIICPPEHIDVVL